MPAHMATCGKVMNVCQVAGCHAYLRREEIAAHDSCSTSRHLDLMEQERSNTLWEAVMAS